MKSTFKADLMWKERELLLYHIKTHSRNGNALSSDSKLNLQFSVYVICSDSLLLLCHLVR